MFRGDFQVWDKTLGNDDDDHSPPSTRLYVSSQTHADVFATASITRLFLAGVSEAAMLPAR